MAIALNTTLRNARSTAIVTEAGATAKLSVYTAAYASLLYTSTCAALQAGIAALGQQQQARQAMQRVLALAVEQAALRQRLDDDEEEELLLLLMH